MKTNEADIEDPIRILLNKGFKHMMCYVILKNNKNEEKKIKQNCCLKS